MHPVETFELVLVLLATVVALHWAAAKIGIPPSAALLVGGGALAFLPGIPEISLDPELALVLFLPPLLMDGAYYHRFRPLPPTPSRHPVPRRRRGPVHDPGRRRGRPLGSIPALALGRLLRAGRDRLAARRRRGPGGAPARHAAAPAAGVARRREPAERRHRAGPLPVRRRGDAQRRLRCGRGGGQLPAPRHRRRGGRTWPWGSPGSPSCAA